MTAQGIGAMIGATLGGLMYEKLVPVGVKLGFGRTFGHYSPFFGCAFCVTVGWLLSLRYLRESAHGGGDLGEQHEAERIA
jgi:hypothetical protein